jgi:hypothetical protein
VTLPHIAGSVWYDRLLRPITSTVANKLLADAGARRVGSTHIGHLWVSTVFLSLDHNWQPGEPPLLFETMIFGESQAGGPPVALDGMDVFRYTTEPQAILGHCLIVGTLRTRYELPPAALKELTP